MITIREKSECCGCAACASVCPQSCICMEPDEEGFLYPRTAREKCVNCGLCERVCPVINRAEEIPHKQSAYLVQNRDEQILKESTSGGAFTAIAQEVIRRGGVVFGAAFDGHFLVCHQFVQTEGELEKFRNSKYVQSEIGETFLQAKHFLDLGRLVCFSGTPCQIEGLKNFLLHPYENLIAVDVVCRAVPSPLIWEKYKSLRTNGKSDLLALAAFRDKEPYGYEYSQMSVTVQGGKKQHYGVESDPYLRAFFSNLSDRPSCYACPSKKRYRVSDLTIWDCFNVYKFSKDFDDNRGATRILVHTSKGTEIITSLHKACRIREIGAEDAIKGVKELVCSVPVNAGRRAFFEDANKMECRQFFDKWFPLSAKVRLEYAVRVSCEKLGIYRPVKRIMKKAFRK